MNKILLLAAIIMHMTFFVNAQTGCVSGNCSNGTGKFVWDTGETYEGEWVEGVRDGYGLFTWTDGSYYSGSFMANIREGKGYYHGTDGTIMDGYFKNGDFVGTDEPASTELGDDYFEDEYEDYYEEDFSEGYEDYENFLAEEESLFLFPNQVILYVIEDFVNAFDNLKGEEDFSNVFAKQYFSEVSMPNSKSNVINQPLTFNYWQWYSIITEEGEFALTKELFEIYTAMMDGLDQFNCVLTKTSSEKLDAYNEQYTNTYRVLTSSSDCNYLYTNMVITIEMYKNYGTESYTLMLRVKDIRN